MKTTTTMLLKAWRTTILVLILLCSLTFPTFADEQKISNVTINLEQKNTGLPTITVSTAECTLDSISWLTEKMQPGSENNVKITIKSNSGYVFSSPSFTINGGKYVSTSLSNSDKIVIVVKSSPLYVVFPEPTDVEWDGSFATWEPIDEDYKNFKYEIKYNGKTYTTTQDYYNLSDKLKRNKKYFSVRVIPKNSKTEEYSSASDWVESDELDWDDIDDWCPESPDYPSSYRPHREAYWKEKNGLWYFYNGNSWVENDWVTWNGIRYYLKSNGIMAANETLNIDGKLYFFNPDGSVIRDNWLRINDYWYFIDKNYNFVIGEYHANNGQNYYFYNDGHMATGLINICGQNYYFGSDGAMRINEWALIDNIWYYFRHDGCMVTNEWKEINGKHYYFYSDGSMATNTFIGPFHVNHEGVLDN